VEVSNAPILSYISRAGFASYPTRLVVVAPPPEACVSASCGKGHAAKDLLRFFKQIDARVPRGLAVHVVLDNLSAHKAPEITK